MVATSSVNKTANMQYSRSSTQTMFFQKLLLFFFATWCLAESNDSNIVNGSDDNLQKSFTAECSTLADVYGTCKYSAFFDASSNINYVATAKISINGVGEPFPVEVFGSEPVIVNSEVSKGDEVVIDFELTSTTDPTNVFFRVKNRPDGAGGLIVGSRFLNFYVANPCENNCNYNFSRRLDNINSYWRSIRNLCFEWKYFAVDCR